MKKVILITRCPSSYHQGPLKVIQDIQQEFDVRSGPADTWMPREKLMEEVKSAHALLCYGHDRINKEIIDQATHLQVIALLGAGYNTVDVEYATEKGIYVCNTPDVVNDSTSEIAFFLILACCRRATQSENFVRTGQWQGNAGDLERFMGVNLPGKTVGIIGMGGIGKSLVKKLQGWNVNILYHNRNRLDQQVEKGLSVKYSTLDELLAQSDIISIHTPLNDQTKHLIDIPQFQRMKKGAILINTSRGPVVNEKALVDALNSGQLSGAGLDVFEKEPIIEPGLLKHPNVTVLPHVGTMTVEARSAMWTTMLTNALNVLRGLPPVTNVNSPTH